MDNGTIEMNEIKRRVYLALNVKPMTATELQAEARYLLGTDKVDVAALLDEMEREGAIRRKERHVTYDPKMTLIGAALKKATRWTKFDEQYLDEQNRWREANGWPLITKDDVQADRFEDAVHGWE